MAKISYLEMKKNSKLTSFEELKDLVVSNTVRLHQKKMMKKEANSSLFDY